MANTFSNPSDPWQFGEKIKSDASKINRYLEYRKMSESTISKVMPHLLELTEEYKDIPVYGTSPALYSPVNGGIGCGPGVATGRLIGFSIGELNPITERRQTDPRAIRLGAVALIGESMFRAGYDTGAEPSWRLNVLPETIRQHYDKPGSVIGVPTHKEAKFLKLHEYRTPEDVSGFIEATKKNTDTHAIEEAIGTINALANGHPIDEAVDPIHMRAILGELDYLNKTAPMIGSFGAYDAQLSWSPSRANIDSSLLRYNATIMGDFRKFIYGPYPDEHGNIKYAVQLVVYPPLMTDAVRTGRATAQEVDSTHAQFIIFA